MIYCKKCGAEVNPQTGCCVMCNTSINDKVRNKDIAFLKFMAICLILLVVFLVGNRLVVGVSSRMNTGDDSYIEVAEDCIDALFVNPDVKKFYGLMHESVIQNMINEYCDGDEDQFYADIEEMNMGAGEHSADPDSLKWEIVEEIDVVGTQKTHYIEYFKEQTGSSEKIEAIKGLDIKVSYTKDGEATKGNLYLLLIYVNEKWYLLEYTGV